MNPSLTGPAPRPGAPKPIDAGWRQWIAENRLRQCTPESMLGTMVASGLDRRESADAIATMERDPGYLAALKHQQLQRKLESILENLQRLWASDAGYRRIDKRAGVSADEF